MKRPNIDKARLLRKNQTDAERKLWSILRNRQFSEIKFRRQFAIKQFILDFYSPEYRLGIEVDGGQHYDEDGTRKDRERTELLESSGVRVLRFNNIDVLSNIEGVSEVIMRTIEEMKSSPSPRSSPRGERMKREGPF